MDDFVDVCVIGFPIWWAGMTLVCLRDYFRRRREAKDKGPLTEQERKEMEEMRAGLPRKDAKPWWWYFHYPKDGLALGGTVLLVLPFVVIFLPMVVLAIFLPNPNRK